MNCALSATVQALRHPILVIGYGNQLRSDDAIGPRIADEVAIWGMPNVRSLTVQQLTPELAETLSEVEIAIFVEACRREDLDQVQVLSLQPPSPQPAGTTTPSLEHTSDPNDLLALTQAVCNRAPRAWWVQVPAVDFCLGDQVSAIAEQGITEALEEIDTLIRTCSHSNPTCQN